ncbi:hypothetical protein O181_055692 [Austropuccinia psidii MF-1]|uniref:Uncharacterized protein n=1 Tax=Austropuccinia psidii MF-1 TaxID=1389203 RepID=A0A9Q3E9C3_9BASI|nr:hypothetical protein [Austropuccinia psidii MF-1]
MPSTRSGASYNPSRGSKKVIDVIMSEGQGSVNESQTDKLCHSEAENTVLPSNRADKATRSLCGRIQSQPEGLQQCISEQRVPDPSRSVEKLHELLPYCEKIPGPSQHLQVTQWMEYIDGKEEHDTFNRRMEEKQPSTTQESSKNSPNRKKTQFQHEEAATSSEQGKRKALATKTYSKGDRIPKIQKDAMKNVFQMARTMME